MNITSDGWVYCDVINSTVVSHFHVPFGFNDAKGRAVGCWVTIRSAERVEREPGSGRVCKPEQMGFSYSASVHVTRNEVTFGGSDASKDYVRTFDEANQWVNAAIERCRKANAKKYAK